MHLYKVFELDRLGCVEDRRVSARLFRFSWVLVRTVDEGARVSVDLLVHRAGERFELFYFHIAP